MVAIFAVKRIIKVCHTFQLIWQNCSTQDCNGQQTYIKYISIGEKPLAHEISTGDKLLAHEISTGDTPLAHEISVGCKL